MDSDYQRPFERPFPNFVRMRTVAQMLSQRAQCYLLLGQPEAAWHELALVRDMCRMLEAKPAGNCPTLVEAMIDVAISGLYTQHHRRWAALAGLAGAGAGRDAEAAHGHPPAATRPRGVRGRTSRLVPHV